MPNVIQEKRLALIHRVIVSDEEYPKEYAILVTESRSVFIRQKKTRGNFWLRREMRYGTALITDVVPKSLEDYAQTRETVLREYATDSLEIFQKVLPTKIISS